MNHVSTGNFGESGEGHCNKMHDEIVLRIIMGMQPGQFAAVQTVVTFRNDRH